MELRGCNRQNFTLFIDFDNCLRTFMIFLKHISLNIKASSFYTVHNVDLMLGIKHWFIFCLAIKRSLFAVRAAYLAGRVASPGTVD